MFHWERLNRDVERRDNLIANYGTQGFPPENYDIFRFEGISEDTLRTLRDEKFLSIGEKQNFAPTVGEFIEFMERFPDLYTAHGYAVSIHRSDYRVSIEGIKARRRLTASEKKEFVKFAREADEFDQNGYCWWD